MKFRSYKHILQFKFDAGTSRGVLKTKNSYILEIWEEGNEARKGIGEAGPLFGLSPEYQEDLLQSFNNRMEKVFKDGFPRDKEAFQSWLKTNPIPEASFQMAFEMAYLNWLNFGKDIYFQNDFSNRKSQIPINGLIWMGEKDFMLKQIREKIDAGFTCLKMKIGAINFQDEISILEFIRKEFSSEFLKIRVDANGAFDPKSALQKLNEISKYDVHSIEQPIMAGQIKEMAELCKSTPLPIALDEELIGIREFSAKNNLINEIKPQYLIFKPSLLGGFVQTNEWIELAKNKDIPWWITSALESNYGLNAIAQFAAEYENDLEQGLGTGSLYHNNFDSDLRIDSGYIKLI